MTARVIVYSTGRCPLCAKAKTLLDKWGIPYTELRVDQDPAHLREMLAVTGGARTVPQIVIDGRSVGGFTDLTELHMEGALDHLVEGGGAA